MPVSAGLRYARLYADDGGVTHFADEALSWEPTVPLAWGTAFQDARAISFRRLAPGFAHDWHPAPQRQFVVVLSGVMEIEAGDGEARQFGPGGVVLVTDLTGPGHRTRNPGMDETVLIWVPGV